MGTVYRLSWHTGSIGITQHAADYLTQSAAEQRKADLKAAGVSRVEWYRAEGDGARGCWCDECALDVGRMVPVARVPDSARESA